MVTFLKEKAYKAILRPKMEYCSASWDPRKGVEKEGSYKVEVVQRRAARWVLSRHYPLDSVTDMINTLGWDTLEKRRTISRVMLLYKIVSNLVSVDSARANPTKPTRRSRQTKHHTFNQITCRSEAYKLSFPPRNN